MIEEFQTTIARPVEFKGTGLHKGMPCRMKVEPGPPDSGFVFVSQGTVIPAKPASAVNSIRNTELREKGVAIYTVEHILSALYGCGVDNARIIMDAQEPPAMDGSAIAFAKAIMAAGVIETESPRDFITLKESIKVGGENNIVGCAPDAEFSINCVLSYDHPMIGSQDIIFKGGAEEYLEMISPARTFALIEEVEALRAAGRALGGSEDNAIVVYRDRYSSELRFKNEFVRHKVLDLIGDLALLAPARLCATVFSVRGGHALNATLAGILAKGFT